MNHATEFLRENANAYHHALAKCHYSEITIAKYLASIEHFCRWMSEGGSQLNQINEYSVARFLDVHLPACQCPSPTNRCRKDLSAALGHLLIILRSRGVISEPIIVQTPVDKELQKYDSYMHEVKGLVAKTRSMSTRIVKRFLIGRFELESVDIDLLLPEHVRMFYAEQCKLYSKPASSGAVISALRGYFRYRSSLGDNVHGLIGAISYPCNWQLSSLPKSLSKDEVNMLVGSLGQPGRSLRRSDAVVRCALDLGLRGAEIAKLMLDDIDWKNGTITLRGTKGRRIDVLPLPSSTGEALAAYLKYERPTIASRVFFARLVAPREQPIGPDVIRKIIRQAYARAGLPYTKAHLLRHTMANRLLDSGASLKEVADVLRHRSLNTSLIYAKLDCRSLGRVAAPWPGSAS